MLICLLVSCDDGEFSERYETLVPFHTIELNSVFDVYLVQDTVYGIRISAHENVIKNVLLSVDTGILRISNESRIKWMSPESNKVKLFIHAENFYEIWPNETCYIKSVKPIISDEIRLIMGHHPKLSQIDLDLDCNSFLYWNNHQCGGKVTLKGRTTKLFIYSYGLMTVEADKLNTEFAVVENNSKGDCKVSVADKLEYSIRGVGNIYLSGQPREIVRGEVSSSGRLIEAE